MVFVSSWGVGRMWGEGRGGGAVSASRGLWCAYASLQTGKEVGGWQRGAAAGGVMCRYYRVCGGVRVVRCNFEDLLLVRDYACPVRAH